MVERIGTSRSKSNPHQPAAAIAKPIPTARRRAKTFDAKNLRPTESPYVRSDVCVVPALAVIAECVAAWEILRVFLEKFGGDNIDDTLTAYTHYKKSLDERLRR